MPDPKYYLPWVTWASKTAGNIFMFWWEKLDANTIVAMWSIAHRLRVPVNTINTLSLCSKPRRHTTLHAVSKFFQHSCNHVSFSTTRQKNEQTTAETKRKEDENTRHCQQKTQADLHIHTQLPLIPSLCLSDWLANWLTNLVKFGYTSWEKSCWLSLHYQIGKDVVCDTHM